MRDRVILQKKLAQNNSFSCQTKKGNLKDNFPLTFFFYTTKHYKMWHAPGYMEESHGGDLKMLVRGFEARISRILWGIRNHYPNPLGLKKTFKKKKKKKKNPYLVWQEIELFLAKFPRKQLYLAQS